MVAIGSYGEDDYLAGLSLAGGNNLAFSPVEADSQAGQRGIFAADSKGTAVKPAVGFESRSTLESAAADPSLSMRAMLGIPEALAMQADVQSGVRQATLDSAIASSTHESIQNSMHSVDPV